MWALPLTPLPDVLALHDFPFPPSARRARLHVYSSDRADAERLVKSAFVEIQRIESRYSRYRTDSDLSHLNQVAATGGSLEVDDETAGLLNYAYASYEKSGGLFDITSGILRKAWD